MLRGILRILIASGPNPYISMDRTVYNMDEIFDFQQITMGQRTDMKLQNDFVSLYVVENGFRGEQSVDAK